MDPENGLDLSAVRARLLDELDDVTGKSERLMAHLRNKDRSPPKDWSDLAQFTGNDEVLEALDARARDRVAALQRAVDRIDAGRYGRCDECGAEIAMGRLEMLPTTITCAGCAPD